MEDKLQSFRAAVYGCVNYAKDAFMDLVDALSSFETKSVVELSLSPHFKRRHHSIPRAIHDCTSGRNGHGNQVLDFTNCLIRHSTLNDDTKCRSMALDETPRPTPYSLKLPKRIVHQATPTPGQKPIAIGQSISVLGEPRENGSWFLPYSAERVPSDQSAVLFGLEQVEKISSHLTDKVNIISADFKYSTAAAVSRSWSWDNDVLLARLSPTRVFYHPYHYTPDDIKKRGRPSIYGETFRLRENTETKPDVEVRLEHHTSKGELWKVSVARFDNLLIKADAKNKLQNKPVSIFRISIQDESGSFLYKEPLWLIGSGKPAKIISLKDVFHSYNKRFSIEHWFRFSKQKLLFDSFQTCNIEHSDNWLYLPVLATHMLYHSRYLASAEHRPWEKPSKNSTPAQVKRGMSAVLDKIGSPTQPPKLRGIGLGRIPGSQNQVARETLPIEYKASSTNLAEGKIIIKVASDSLQDQDDIQINVRKLPACGRELKRALKQLLETGQATLDRVA